MAKRKRLSPLPLATVAGAPETAADIFPDGAPGMAHLPLAMAPIAAVAADGAAQAALSELSEEMARARAEGRMILSLPLDAVDETYLVRDRMVVEDEEQAALVASIRTRGQQTPIEVADLGEAGADGRRWGLISGWRRLRALRVLAGENPRFETVLAILRRPEQAAGAYLAMVEENEIRAGLSFYERARIVARAADQGVYPDDRAALAHLFAAAPKARRSKIGSFVRLVRALDGALRFPTHLSEKAGLSLAGALDRDPSLAGRIAAALNAEPPATPAAELAQLAVLGRRATAGPGQEPAASDPGLAPPAPPAGRPDFGPGGLELLSRGDDRLVLKGPAVAAPAFRQALIRWLVDEGWLDDAAL